MIDHVCAVSEIEIDDVHAVNFADFLIILAAVDVFGHEFRSAEKHTLEVGKFRVVLHFDEK